MECMKNHPPPSNNSNMLDIWSLLSIDSTIKEYFSGNKLSLYNIYHFLEECKSLNEDWDEACTMNHISCFKLKPGNVVEFTFISSRICYEIQYDEYQQLIHHLEKVMELYNARN
ncbi:hypothetical protein [Risungbinella massiliensis]|uniref:hypothetical protein n=1 Tax=Risungbinella massiliensis TaxID=1329796 RepID=UPI0005CC7364|nr:hypothetical protein [Risungbinella massiliensis]